MKVGDLVREKGLQERTGVIMADLKDGLYDHASDSAFITHTSDIQGTVEPSQSNIAYFGWSRLAKSTGGYQ